LVSRAGKQQAAQQPGHQAVAGQDHGNAEYVIGQRRGLMFGDRYHGHQGQHHQPETANPALQEFDLRFFPAKMQLRHAPRRQNPVRGVEHQPRQTYLQQGRAQVAVLSSGVDLQRITAQRQAQRQGHGQQDVDQDRQRRVPLAVTFEVADVRVQFVQLAVERIALPDQGADQQQQRQEQQRALGQAIGQLTDTGSPWQRRDLFHQPWLNALEPLQVQRFIAGDPEHLLIKGRTQAAGGADQLFLAQLQGDGFVEQGAQFAVQALQQVGAGGSEIDQGLAQLWRDVFGLLGRQQGFDVGGRAAHLLALLVDLELIQADIGDFVRQPLVQGQVRQGLLLFVENLGQQQTAPQDVDLFIQRLIALCQVVQLLLGLEVLLGQVVEAVGAAQQVVGQLEVGGTFRRQQATAAGLLRFDGQLGHGLLRLCTALVVDQGLQVLDFLLLTADFFGQQVVLGAAQILQLTVAGQFLATQQGQGIDRGQFGVELVTLIGTDRLAVVFAHFEDGVDLLGAGLVAADLGLGALGAGLGGDGQAVGVIQGFLQVAQLRAALAKQLLQLRHVEVGIALGNRDGFGGLELGQLALIINGLLRCLRQLLFESGKTLLAVLLARQQGERLLQHLLQRLLVDVRQLAVGNLVQALLHGFAGGWFGSHGRDGGQAKPKQGGNDKITQREHRHRSN